MNVVKKKIDTHFEKNQKSMTTIKIYLEEQFSLILKYFKK